MARASSGGILMFTTALDTRCKFIGVASSIDFEPKLRPALLELYPEQPSGPLSSRGPTKIALEALACLSATLSRQHVAISLSSHENSATIYVAQDGCAPEQLARVTEFIRQVWGALIAISEQSKSSAGVSSDAQDSLRQVVYSYTAEKALRRINKWWGPFHELRGRLAPRYKPYADRAASCLETIG
ncbi:hypothetical protein BOTBODRAFT_169582 [Botryobasidium botryosum FD-172 SS1]|uniref:Uncharacterized protein n=1 Tax=Botryobasidium botryosum (strain FD-172 SS1) TaxID=930990 RepID=A0A067MYR9_BOTB1|nr:hypothetical protein BOTBODRAFT_169582 [Botryobasidium botryosum FD-172 SS1]